MPFKGTEKKSHLHIWPLTVSQCKKCKQKSMGILSAELDLECMSVMEELTSSSKSLSAKTLS